MTTTLMPDGWKLPKRFRDELPPGEVPDAATHLWSKSSGLCALCGDPLPADGKRVDVDHMVAVMEGVGGETRLSNLYLAHAECNRARQNLPFPLAKAVIRFSRWCRGAHHRTFTDVTQKYLTDPGQRVRIVDNSESSITLAFGSDEVSAPVFMDPATSTRYFFMDVPVQFIKNDDQSQPRFIEHDHVRVLASDFYVRPVHEPSNCRLVPVEGTELADLLQFDGQHKATAQIILERKTVPMKFYFDPDESMIQALVVQVQQGIKKRPLSTTDTLRKLDDVLKDLVEDYKKLAGRAPTEKELVESQPKQFQSETKKRLLANFGYLVEVDGNLALKQYIDVKAGREIALTDKVFLSKVAAELISQELQTESLEDAVSRETEREQVVWLLNIIAEEMLVDKFKPSAPGQEDLQTIRARNFFYQGAIRWWMPMLLQAVSFAVPKANGGYFLRPLNDHEQAHVEAVVRSLCSWEAWSTQNEVQVAAMRSNTASKVSEAFSDFTIVRLMNDVRNAMES